MVGKNLKRLRYIAFHTGCSIVGIGREAESTGTTGWVWDDRQWRIFGVVAGF